MVASVYRIYSAVHLLLDEILLCWERQINIFIRIVGIFRKSKDESKVEEKYPLDASIYLLL